MRFIIRKLVNGRAVLRDDQVKQCIQSGQDLEIELGNQEMVIFCERITSLGNWGEESYPSQYNNSSYKLVDFNWVPKEIVRKKSKIDLVKEQIKKREKEEYEKLTKEFKPTFGSQRSLQVIHTVKKIEDLEEDIKERLKDITVIKKKQEEINKLKQEVVYLIKKG